MEAFCGAEGRAVEPLEIRAVVKRDWAGPRQRPCGRFNFCWRVMGGSLRRCVSARLRALTLAEREEISRGIASGSSIRGIAKGLKRAVSTVSREVARHGGRPLYRASEADQQAWASALRPKTCLLANHEQLRAMVASKLLLDWSPEQIAGWLQSQYPNDASLRVSHETIYRSLFIQARGVLKQELVKHLRSQRRIRRSQHSSIHGHSQGRIVDAISIRERPAEAEDRAIPGHWEGDLLRGAGNSHVATLVERHSRFCLLVKVSGKDTATVVAALSQHVLGLPATLRRSLTWDRGLEMAQHKSFTMATDVQVYFLRSTESLATRFKRKHQRATQAIPTEEGGSVLLLAVGARQDRSASQSTATKNVGISDPGG